MSQEQTPRFDQENRLGLEFHAPRTALRLFNGVADPEARRTAVVGAIFREQGAHAGEAVAMRTKLLQMLDRVEGKLTPEQLRLMELVKAQFAGETEVYRKFGLYDPKHPNEGDVAAPSVEAASQALLTQLTPTQVAEILKQAKQPQFQMEAVTSFARYVAALDAHKKMPGQIDTYVNSNRRVAWAAQDAAAGIGKNIIGWNVGIIDVAQELEAADPELSGDLGQKRNQAEAKLSSSGLRLPNHRRYALAQMRALQQGKPLDVVNWSVLNDDTGDDAVVPGGLWDADQVGFRGDFPDGQRGSVRFRPEVVAKAV